MRLGWLPQAAYLSLRPMEARHTLRGDQQSASSPPEFRPTPISQALTGGFRALTFQFHDSAEGGI